MAKFDISIELAHFRNGILGAWKGHEAVRETLRLQGTGETINSRRKKEPYENKKPQHGRFISWFFREKLGVDPYDTSGDDFAKILDDLVKDYEEILSDAFRDEDAKRLRMKVALLAAAETWAESVQNRVKSGKLGTCKDRANSIKKAMIKAGMISSKHGSPPPRGIRSGRWVDGIRGRWRQGRL